MALVLRLCQRTASLALSLVPCKECEGTRVLSRLQATDRALSHLTVFPFPGLSCSEACVCNSRSSSVVHLGRDLGGCGSDEHKPLVTEEVGGTQLAFQHAPAVSMKCVQNRRVSSVSKECRPDPMCLGLYHPCVWPCPSNPE